MIEEFPPIESAEPSGLLAVGGDLEPPSLLLAYSSGIFPWPPREGLLAWFAPPKRAVLFLDEMHRSRSLRRAQRTTELQFKLNTDFRAVIEACARAPRSKESGTWITRQMIDAYTELHTLGFAHSIEAWRGGQLAGGLYGVSIGGFFSAESMFFIEPNASKLALAYLADLLGERGASWIDLQVINPFTASLGAREIARSKYMSLLRTALKKPPLFSTGAA